MSRRVKSMALCAGLLALLSSGTAGAADAVVVQKFAFVPREITIAPGATVQWTNKDETPHTISATDRGFVSKALDTDDHYEHTFVSEGDYSYFCTLHPFMTGVVHVRAAAADAGRK
jgi:plastocyanin